MSRQTKSKQYQNFNGKLELFFSNDNELLEENFLGITSAITSELENKANIGFCD